MSYDREQDGSSVPDFAGYMGFALRGQNIRRKKFFDQSFPESQQGHGSGGGCHCNRENGIPKQSCYITEDGVNKNRVKLV